MQDSDMLFWGTLKKKLRSEITLAVFVIEKPIAKVVRRKF